MCTYFFLKQTVSDLKMSDVSSLLYSDKPRQVSLLSCWDVFVYRTCLGHNCSVEEKLEFLKEVKMF